MKAQKGTITIIMYIIDTQFNTVVSIRYIVHSSKREIILPITCNSKQYLSVFLDNKRAENVSY
jgi:hypothetical protein